MYSGISSAALAGLFVCKHACHATLHMAISLSRFRCACQRYEKMTTKKDPPTMSLCELDHRSTECYYARNKELKERQREVKGGLEQLQRACLECLNLSSEGSVWVRFHLGRRPSVPAKNERRAFLIRASSRS